MKPATQQVEVPVLKWSQMTRRQKMIYIAKLTVCILSFGFIFPNISNE